MISIDDFLTDPDYLGHLGEIRPRTLEGLRALFARPVRDAEVTGGMASGKTMFTRLALARTLYELLNLDDPVRTYGMAEGSNINLLILGGSDHVAANLIRDFRDDFILPSPYFRTRLLDSTKRELSFGRNLWVAGRSCAARDYLGMNVVAAVIEGEAMTDPNQGRAAQAQLRRRIRSRGEGALPNLLLHTRTKEEMEIDLGAAWSATRSTT